MPIMWCLANPKLGGREVIAALLNTTTSSATARSCWPARASSHRPNDCALVAGSWHNLTTGVTIKRSLIAYRPLTKANFTESLI
jgi:hypothetical protein